MKPDSRMPRATLADLPVPAPEPDDLGATRRPARNHGRKIFGDMQSDARAALAGHSPGVTDIRTSDTRYLARLAAPTSTPGNPPPGCRPRSAPWGLESPGGHKSAVVDTTAVQACTATPRRPPRAAHRPENSRRKNAMARKSSGACPHWWTGNASCQFQILRRRSGGGDRGFRLAGHIRRIRGRRSSRVPPCSPAGGLDAHAEP
jgi:hypothetical protein